MYRDDGSPPSMDINQQQRKILTQLFKMMPTYHTIDEMFQWLAYTIAQQCNAPLLQFWTNQINERGQRTTQLRTIIRQDASIPGQLAVSEDVALLAQKIIYERLIYHPQTIDSQFPQYRVSILRRYGLNVFAACSLYANLLLPAVSNNASTDIPTPLAISMILFLRQQPNIDPIPSIMTIMNLAIVAAGTRGLLLSASGGLITQRISSGYEFPPLEKLIPHRKQNDQLMLSSNPLSSSTIITDKAARRLYGLIDGQNTMTTLCQRTGMSMREACAALHILLKQERIEVRSASGTLIDADFIMKDS